MLLFLKNYQPFLIDPNKTPHLNDWLLDITGSLMIVFFNAFADVTYYFYNNEAAMDRFW